MDNNSQTPAEKPLVLLVDDLPANLHVLVAGLKNDFRLKTATSGAETLALLGHHYDLPKLIVLDVKMPGMSGIEVLRRIRCDPHISDIPVILLTADASEQNELAGLNLGADDYLVKPISPNVLAVRAHNLIQRCADGLQLRLAAHVFEYSGEAIMITDRDNLLVDVNAAFTSLTGYEKAEVLGRNPKFLSSGRTTPEEYQKMWTAILQDSFWQGELWDRCKDGHVYPKMMTISVIRDRAGDIEFYLANFVDVSHYKETEERIYHIAHHDPLTGLPNRLHLQVFLEQSLLIAKRMSEQVAVMFLDLDRFKTINDTLGHNVGDDLLIQVAGRLRASVREYDMVARLGGDEFVVVLRGYEVAINASIVAENIRQSLSKPFQLGSELIRTTTSIGIATFPDNAEQLGDLLKDADTAMYFAKSRGGNAFCFFSNEMNQYAHERLQLENQLHEAIDKQQFELYYQPQIAIQNEKLIGAEVLLRWRHPEKGFISPAIFIPLAEATNQICRIGEWVLENACKQASEWLREGLSLPRIGVNVSAKQCQNRSFADIVTRVLAETGLPAERLELEITETAVSDCPEEAGKLLQSFRDIGIQIAMDDFGTGYSSLGQLKDLPLDRLKIDASFVRDITENDNSKSGIIAAATIGLGHGFGFEVIAEGVETEAQLAFLRNHGCDEVQGYYFAKPMPKTEFEAFMKAWL